MDQAYPTVTSLPTNPINGMVVYYLADDTNGVVWPFKYRSASASTYKWEAVGPTPLFAKDTTTRNTSSATFQTTGAPTLTTPLTGDYDIDFGAAILVESKGAGNNDMRVGLHINGSLTDQMIVKATAASNGTPATAPLRNTAITATHVIQPRYKSEAAISSDFTGLFVRLTPIRVI